MSLDSKVVIRHHRQKKKILIAIAIIFLLTPTVLEQEYPSLLKDIFSIFPEAFNPRKASRDAYLPSCYRVGQILKRIIIVLAG